MSAPATAKGPDGGGGEPPWLQGRSWRGGARGGQAIAAARGGLLLLALCVLVVSALAYGAASLLYGPVPGDDAFITFRYAHNVLAGHGPVWNPGEERVEGYSNPLFLGLLVLLGALGIPIPTAADLLNVAGLALLLGVVVLWCRELHPGAAASWLAPWIAGGIVVLHPSVAYYLREGLETVLHTGLVAFAFFVVRGTGSSRARTVAAALLGALVAISRPEGLLVTAILGLVSLACGGDRWRRGALFAGCAGALIACWLALRVGFYGDLLPNTYYVKLSEPLSHRILRGGEYIVGGGGVLLFLPLAFSPLWRLETPRQRRSLMVVIAGLLTALVFPLLAGGDWMRAHRFLLPALPFAALLWGMTLGRVWRTASGPLPGLRLGAGALALLATLSGAALGHHELARASQEDADWIAAHQELGTWLRDRTSPDALIALGAVGAVGYWSQRPVLDCWGLNDSWIARRGKRVRGVAAGHQAYDGEYVWRRRPTWVFPFNGPLSEPLEEEAFRRLVLDTAQPSRFWAAEWMAQPGFATTYRYRLVEPAPGIWFGGYRRVGEGAPDYSAVRPKLEARSARSTPSITPSSSRSAAAS